MVARRPSNDTWEQGKLQVRERIEKLLDSASPFLELSPLAAFDMYNDEAPSAGIVTGIGCVSGREVMIIANDATVKGGTYYPLYGKEALRVRSRLRWKTGCPAYTQLRTRAAASSRSKRKYSPTRSTSAESFSIRRACPRNAFPRLEPLWVPAQREALIYRPCRTKRSSFRAPGQIFLGGPPLVKAATGEEVTAEDLGGADVHTRLSGVADYFAEDDEHALQLTRNILATLNTAKLTCADMATPEDPLYDPREIYGIVSTDFRKTHYDVSVEIIAHGSRKAVRGLTSSRLVTHRPS